MDLSHLQKVSATEWRLEPHGAMRVPAVLYASDEELIAEMDDKVLDRAAMWRVCPGSSRRPMRCPTRIGAMASRSVASPLSIPRRAGWSPPAGSGSTFPAACGRCSLASSAPTSSVKHDLADSLYRNIPAGLGSTGKITLDASEMDAMLAGGAHWAIGLGYGSAADLDRIEERGTMAGAKPDAVSDAANGNTRKWARSAPAITISSCKRLRPSMTRRRRAASD